MPAYATVLLVLGCLAALVALALGHVLSADVVGAILLSIVTGVLGLTAGQVAGKADTIAKVHELANGHENGGAA